MRFEFGDFTLDADARQLLRHGVAVHLSPKSFDLLLSLIQARPRALSKSDLHRRLWPKTFVSDASLAMLVAEVRAALGETARQARSVRTVHRHGYAFQADAREVSATGEPRAAADASPGYWLVTSSREIPLTDGDNIIGRDPKLQVWLDSPSVSRRHARIRVSVGHATIEDLGSKNGTRARDASVTTATPILDGDELRFGSVTASFRMWTGDLTRTEADSV